MNMAAMELSMKVDAINSRVGDNDARKVNEEICSLKLSNRAS